MDRTVKLLLAIIAFSLVSLNLQLAGVSLVSEAKAQKNSSASSDITPGLLNIAASLQSIADAISFHD